MLINAKDIILQSIDLFKNNTKTFFTYILLTLIPAILFPLISIGVAFIAFGGSAAASIGAGIIVFILTIIILLVNFWVQITFTKVISDLHDGTPIKKIKEMFANSKHALLPGIGVSVLVAIYTGWPLFLGAGGYAAVQAMSGLGKGSPMVITALGIIFGLIAAYGLFHIIFYSIRYTFSLYGVVIEGHKIKESIKESTKLVRGRWWSILWRLLIPGLLFWIVLAIIQAIFSGIIALFDNEIIGGIVTLVAIIPQLITIPLFLSAVIILFHNAQKNPATIVGTGMPKDLDNALDKLKK